MASRISSTRLSRLKKTALVSAILIVLYAIFGFLIAPPILKSKLISTITQRLGRTATVQKVKVNPFALSVTIKGFRLNEPDGGRFVSFDELHVNFQLSTIFRRAFTFAEIRLVSPDGAVKILSNGKLNFSDLIPARDAPEPTTDGSGKLPPVLIYRLHIGQGRLTFRDLSRPTVFEANIFPIQLSLDNFSTRIDTESPYGFTANAGEAGILTWAGNVSVNPLRSRGRFELTGVKKRTLWKYIKDQVDFEVISGSLDVAGQYYVDASGEDIHGELIDGKAELTGFKLAEKGGKRPLISVPLLSVRGINADLRKREAMVAAVYSSDARLEAWLTRKGTVNYLELVPKELLESKPAETGDRGESEREPWKIVVNEVTLEDYGVKLENRTFTPPVSISLELLDLNLKNLSNEKDSRVEVSLASKVNQAGTIEVNGVAGINPVSAAFKVRAVRFPLKPYQPILDTMARIELVSGTASLDGVVNYLSLGKGGPRIRYKGGASIDDLNFVDHAFSKDFLKWKSLTLNGLVFDLEPNKLSIAEIVAKKPFARVIIWADLTVNVTEMLKPKSGQKGDEAIFLAARPIEKTQSPIPIKIDKVSIENGSANFADFSLKPSFATGIQDLNGTIKGLSSDSWSRADVLLNGKVDRYAPVSIAGQINPLSGERYSDLRLSFKNMELTTVTPYSGKFAGYRIDKGKMSLDLRYKLSKNILIGENEIFIDQLTLGERVESTDATSLPVKLAIALLRDRHGRIDIELPVRGDLNDPEFSYGSVVLTALVNLITKIVTSPFAALASLVGGDGEELSFVEFEFGNATLVEEQTEKLDKLAEALQERPALQLEIKATADREYDRVALAETELLNQLKQAKLEELRASRRPVPESAENISLSDDDFARLLTQNYVNTFGEDPASLLASESKTLAQNDKAASTDIEASGTAPGKPAEPPSIDPEVVIVLAKKRLLENIPVDELSLRRLAQERARQIKGHLIEKGEIPDEQLFIVEVEIDGASDGDRIRTNLSLSSR